MKKAIFAKPILVTVAIILCVLTLYPLTVSAAWWKLSTWKVFDRRVDTSVSPTSDSSTSVASTTIIDTSLSPSVDDLKKRIAELEDKLADMTSRLKDAEKVAEKATEKVAVEKATVQKAVETKTASSNSGLSEKEITAKVRPAIVLIETLSGSATGAIIDASGNIITNAKVVIVRDSNGFATGTVDSITVTMSDGSRKKASVVGLDEATDIAVIRITEKGSYSFIKPNHDGGISEGDTAYIFSLPFSSASSVVSIGYGVADSVIVKKGSSSIEVNSTKKPFDTGGAIVNDAGGFIGIPNNSSCKVLEEMKTCLKYTVTANIIRSKLPKLTEGMILYKDYRNRSKNEELVMGQLQAMYAGVNRYGPVDYAIEISSGKNSFDNLNSRLGDDMDGKITKLYLNKLKISAENISRAMDSLKSLSYNLRTFLINESAMIETLGTYQQKVLAQIKTTNEAKLKDYTSKVDLWSKKKNEYDQHIADPSGSTHDYMMEEALFVESAIEYLKTERQRILDTFSGENFQIF